MHGKRKKYRDSKIQAFKPLISRILVYFTVYCLLTPAANAIAVDLKLQDMIDEALKNNHEILASESRVAVSKYRIPQAKSLPDPMFMFGYQNEGYERYTYGDMLGAQWMFSASQNFPFPGKLSVKEEMAVRDSETLAASYESTRLKTILRVKDIYYNLFLAHKSLDLIRSKAALFSRIEDASLARYSAGMALQQEVLMAQTEKYMLLEKEEMLKQKVQSLEAMLNTTVGRNVNSPLGRPIEPVYTPYPHIMDEQIKTAYENSPEIKFREKMIASAEAKVQMAKKEYYPDFTLGANLYKRRGELDDMWSLTTTINIPIFYRTKQRMAVLEATSALSEARHEIEATKLMLASGIRENYSMLTTTERLMELYKNGLIPKTYQDFEQAIAGYTTGKIEAITVISRLKSFIDYELLYWEQFVEREKAIARLEALTGVRNQ
ncbi:MAG: TolC family protein [Thermodesulfobacteriota bacterium]